MLAPAHTITAGASAATRANALVNDSIIGPGAAADTSGGEGSDAACQGTTGLIKDWPSGHSGACLLAACPVGIEPFSGGCEPSTPVTCCFLNTTPAAGSCLEYCGLEPGLVGNTVTNSFCSGGEGGASGSVETGAGAPAVRAPARPSPWESDHRCTCAGWQCARWSLGRSLRAAGGHCARLSGRPVRRRHRRYARARRYRTSRRLCKGAR